MQEERKMVVGTNNASRLSIGCTRTPKARACAPVRWFIHTVDGHPAVIRVSLTPFGPTVESAHCFRGSLSIKPTLLMTGDQLKVYKSTTCE